MNTIKYMSGSDCDALLEDELSHHDPTRAAHLFTVLQRLLTPTSQQDGGTLYLHRGVNATRRVFFKALCEAIGGCVWIDTALPASMPIRIGHYLSRFPTLVVLDDISTEALSRWPHLWSLVASPHTQVHALQNIAFPSERVTLPGVRHENYGWRDTSAPAVIGVEALAPAIAAWLGIVGGAHPPDTHLCAAVDVLAPAIVPATPETPPSARSPRRGLRGATPALWSLGGACEPGETFSAPSTASSADTTPIGQAPSAVSPSAATWPQESQSAATATQPGSTRSSAETVQPSGNEAGDFIVIHGVKLPLVHVVADLKADGSGVVKIKLRLFADENNDWWENYRCVKARLMEHGLQERAIVPVEHTSLSLVGVTSLVFTKLGAPVRARDGYEVDLEGVPPRKEATKRIPRGPLDALAQRAAATAVYPGAGTGDLTAQLYTALSLAGEAGEVAGKASKVLRDGVTPALLAAIHRELGDVLWHWLMACVEWGAEPDRIAEEMLQRLQDRARRGVVRGSGDER